MSVTNPKLLSFDELMERCHDKYVKSMIPDGIERMKDKHPTHIVLFENL